MGKRIGYLVLVVLMTISATVAQEKDNGEDKDFFAYEKDRTFLVTVIASGALDVDFFHATLVPLSAPEKMVGVYCGGKKRSEDEQRKCHLLVKGNKYAVHRAGKHKYEEGFEYDLKKLRVRDIPRSLPPVR